MKGSGDAERALAARARPSQNTPSCIAKALYVENTALCALCSKEQPITAWYSDGHDLQRNDGGVERGNHLCMRAAAVIVPIRNRADRLPFEGAARLVKGQAKLPGSALDCANRAKAPCEI